LVESRQSIILYTMTSDRLFRKTSLVQLCIHLCAYLASFVKLILIDAGGYYDVGVWAFIGITLGTMPLFAIEWRLIQHSLRLSSPQRAWGYLLNFGICLWSVWIIKVSYFG
jgi:hypothetical protein